MPDHEELEQIVQNFLEGEQDPEEQKKEVKQDEQTRSNAEEVSEITGH